MEINLVKKVISLVCVSAMAAGLCFTSTMASAKPPAGMLNAPDKVQKKIQSRETFPHKAGELLVKMKPGAARLHSADIIDSRSFRVPQGLKSQDITHWRVVTIKGRQDLRSVKARLLKNPNVETVEFNFSLQTNLIPNDPQMIDLWGLHNTSQTGGQEDADIDAAEAWDLNTGSADVIVAVIDTGIDYTHPDLINNIWTNPGEIPGNNIDDDGNGYIDDIHGYDFANMDSDPFDDNLHGTHVAGTIAAQGNNGIGIAGVSWNAKVMGLKFLDSTGSGYTTGAIDAVLYATAMNADLTSNSWGGGGYSQALADAIAANGKLFVAAAGNSALNNDNNSHYPSSYDLPNVLAVAATDSQDQLATFSNYGATTVDITAPGQSILSTVPGGQYQQLSGTSMATPHVSGVAALLLSQYPGMQSEELKARILGGADPLSNLTGMVLTGGRLNALNALETDSVAPADISDLTVAETNASGIQLEWTATGDDGFNGAAANYRIYYAIQPFDGSQVDLAVRLDANITAAAGTLINYSLSGLVPETEYFIRLMAVDNIGNLSQLSNQVMGQTQPAQLLFSDNFENGLGQWTLEGSDGMGGGALWNLTQHKSSSPMNALYYGIQGAFNYNTGQANLGTATTVPFIVAPDSFLTFTHSLSSESTTPYDEAAVQISVANGPWEVVRLLDDAPVMMSVSIDLTSYQGQTIQIRFSFDTKDPIGNDFEGWVIDDVMILGSTASDNIPPGFISDLDVIEVQGSRVDLQWSATGDDGIDGSASAYELRYATTPIDNLNFDTALPITVPTPPQPSGTLESFSVPAGELPTGELFLAIRAVDEVGNKGPVSPSIPVNIAQEYNVILFSDDFSTGAPDWFFSGSDGIGLWHITDHRFNSPSQSLYYGVPGQLNYDTGVAHWGTAESSVIDLAGSHGAKMTFFDFRQAEQSSTFDKSIIEVGVAGAWTPVYIADYVTSVMTAREVDLSAFDGQAIQLRFRFDTVDGAANMYEGWVIDDLQVSAFSANPMPIAQISAVTEAMLGVPVLLDASTSYNPDGQPLSYNWMIDGVALADQSSSLWYIFETPGEHAVYLTVTDGTHSATAAHTIQITNLAPVAVISGPTSGYRFQSLDFTGSGSTDGNGDMLTYSWSVDGVDIGSMPDLSYLFDTLGSHQVSLTVSDGTDSQTAIHNITILNHLPEVSINGPTTGTRGLLMVYSGNATDLDGDPLTYSWLVDGVALSVSSELNYAFDTVGDHLVSLSVNDGQETQTATLSVTIINQAPVVMVSGPTGGNVGEQMSFDGSGSSDADGDALSYSWSVDGLSVGTNPVLAWTFDKSGLHTVTLSVSDGIAIQTATVNVTIENLPPIASAGSDQAVKQRTTVALDASSSYDPQGGSLSYQWVQISGPAVVLSSNTSATPSFTAPRLRKASFETLVFEVTVQNSSGTAAVDRVTVTVKKNL